LDDLGDGGALEGQPLDDLDCMGTIEDDIVEAAGDERPGRPREYRAEA
jgi:hypothetical protein